MHDIDRTLKRIVSNLWFEWNADVHLLFRSISPYIWGLFRRNLYRFLAVQTENPLLYRRHLAQLLVDANFLNLFKKIENDFHSYMKPAETIVTSRYPELADKTVAYFSMEYGLDTFRIYSGGLGILSGDHLRGASDLGLRMVGVGLLYLHGYYDQQVELDGTMKVSYEALVPPHKLVRDFLPVEPAKRAGTTDDLVIEVPIRNRKVKARVWKARIGRLDLLLLDAHHPDNPVHDRHITRRLYASQKHHDEERRRRLEQEILLGIGGVRALAEAGYDPAVYHLNEGHVALAALEVIRQLMAKQGWGFDRAREAAAGVIGFTTHTPVPEGNERFDERLVRDHLHAYLDAFLAPPEREAIFNCARNREEAFDMTKLALLVSGVFRNGVSALHGEVCRRMWGYAWGNHDPEGKNVPIGHITNGVHMPYWQKPLLREAIAEHGGLDGVGRIPDERIWLLHLEFKRKLIDKVRERHAYQLVREKLDVQEIHDRTRNLLSIDSFIIGFARRFADYKRVTMILDDEEHLFGFMERVWQKYRRPIHILYAGKPHPNNQAGRARIRQIVELSGRLTARAQERGFRGQVFFIQGYDIDLARYLVAGVDVWLNNPIRPLEASGTSGMKAGANGALNISIADGWVPEGIVHGKNGWLFGKGDAHSTDTDRRELFRLLEETVLPLYFEREEIPATRFADATPALRGAFEREEGKGCPLYSRRWVAMMKESIRTLSRQFDAERMLIEYTEKMYLPAVRRAHGPAGHALLSGHSSE
jgi:starch phosphorylase